MKYDASKTNTQVPAYRLSYIFAQIIQAALAGLQATTAEEFEKVTDQITAELAKLVNMASAGRKRLSIVDEKHE